MQAQADYTPAMEKMSLSSALKVITTYNGAIASAYKDWARRLPPGPISTLAASMAEQRQDLGRLLTEISADRSLPEVEVDFDIDLGALRGFDSLATTVVEPRELLAKMAEAEAVDHEFLAALAGAVVAVSTSTAENLAVAADSARKRSTWAREHLELLGLS